MYAAASLPSLQFAKTQRLAGHLPIRYASDPVFVKHENQWVETTVDSLDNYFHWLDMASDVRIQYWGNGAKGKGKFRKITGTLNGMVADRRRFKREQIQKKKRKKPFDLIEFLEKLPRENLIHLMFQALDLMQAYNGITLKRAVVEAMGSEEIEEGKCKIPTLKQVKENTEGAPLCLME